MTTEAKTDWKDNPPKFTGVHPSSVFDTNLRIYVPREEFDAQRRKRAKRFRVSNPVFANKGSINFQGKS